jgi:hypothetical protein
LFHYYSDLFYYSIIFLSKKRGRENIREGEIERDRQSKERRDSKREILDLSFILLKKEERERED